MSDSAASVDPLLRERAEVLLFIGMYFGVAVTLLILGLTGAIK